MQTNSLRNWKKDWIYMLFILPALSLFILFFIVPFIRSMYYSVTDLYGYNKNTNMIGLLNYLEAIKDENFINSIIVTLKYTAFVVIIGNIFSLFLAIILDSKIYGTTVLRTLFFLPNVMSLIIVGFVWTFIYGDVYRAISGFLGQGFQISWLGNSDLAIFSIGITAIWQSAGYAMIIYIAGLQNISQEIVEAAYIDGATAKKVLFKIKLPLVSPVILMNLILATTSCLKVFDFPLAMTSGGPAYATTSIALYIYTVGFRMQRTGYAAALSILLFLIILLFTIVLIKFLNTREEKI